MCRVVQFFQCVDRQIPFLLPPSCFSPQVIVFLKSPAEIEYPKRARDWHLVRTGETHTHAQESQFLMGLVVKIENTFLPPNVYRRPATPGSTDRT